MARVVIEGLTRKFAEVSAVADLTLTIEDGEFLSLLGPSGCGKTTSVSAFIAVWAATALRFPQFHFKGAAVTRQ